MTLGPGLFQPVLTGNLLNVINLFGYMGLSTRLGNQSVKYLLHLTLPYLMMAGIIVKTTHHDYGDI